MPSFVPRSVMVASTLARQREAGVDSGSQPRSPLAPLGVADEP